jgi:hypothetical protein
VPAPVCGAVARASGSYGEAGGTRAPLRVGIGTQEHVRRYTGLRAREVRAQGGLMCVLAAFICTLADSSQTLRTRPLPVSSGVEPRA